MGLHPSFVLGLCLTGILAPASVIVGVTPVAAEQVAQANPCAGKLQSVGGPLAEELQGKPVVVDVFATWCAGCKNIEPTLSELKEEYDDTVHFVVLDVTDRGTVKEAEALAERFGLSEFLEANKSKTSTVAIIDPATGDILASYKNNPVKEDYTEVLETALAE